MLPSLGIKKIKAKKAALIKLIVENVDKTWYLCSHDNPDPDSIASAFGMQKILNFLGAEDTHIVYCGEISHPQNRAMQNVLQLTISKWEEEESTPNDMFIFLDCSYNQKNMSIRKTPDIVIDHHKVTVTNKEVLHIIEDVGSCSTLIFDLALSITKQIEVDETAEETSKIENQCFDPDEDDLATALAIGIKTDTNDFLAETTTDFDVQAFLTLARHLSDEKFHRIISYEVPPYVLDYEQIAWQNRNKEYQPHLITGIGYVDESKSDCIPAIADKFRRIQGVQTVVVYGIVEGSIRASVRTSSAAIDCQTLCDDVFGKGNSGAKHGIGGARVRFNIFDPSIMSEENKETLWELVKSQVEAKFTNATTK